jgi:transposase InsO family protein
VDYRKRRAKQAPINIDRAVVERVKSFQFLGVHITNKLSWSKHIRTVMKRARQHLFLLRRLKRLGMGPQSLKTFYSCTVESILTGCITTWHGTCSASERKALEGSAYGPVHHWGQASCHPGPIY